MRLVGDSRKRRREARWLYRFPELPERGLPKGGCRRRQDAEEWSHSLPVHSFLNSIGRSVAGVRDAIIK